MTLPFYCRERLVGEVHENSGGPRFGYGVLVACEAAEALARRLET